MNWPTSVLALVLFVPLHGFSADGVEFENVNEKDPALRGSFHVEIHPSCTLEVIGKLKKEKSETSGSGFYFLVRLRLINAGTHPISVSGYGDWSLITHCQCRNSGETKWPNLKVLGICGTGLRSFTLGPGESHEFQASMTSEAVGTEFRFGVGITDQSLKPSDRIVFTVPQVMPKN